MKVQHCLAAGFAILILGSCSTTRKSHSESHNETKEQTLTEIIQQSDKDSATLFSRSETSDETAETLLEIGIIRYDTSLPADPATGRPPILADITIRDAGKSSRRQQADESLQGNMQEETTTTVNIKKEVELETDSKTADKTIRRPAWWVYALAVGIIWLTVKAIQRRLL